jgi:tetratricopeptide (TPR) repeat protein
MFFYHFLQFKSAIPSPIKCWAQGCALSLGLMGAPLVQAALPAQDTIKQAIQSGQLEQALKLVQQERQSHPKEVQFQFMEGVIQAQQGQSDKAIDTFKKITETHPELSEAYNNLGVLFAAKGRLEESRNYLEKALQTHPSYAAAHRNLSDVHSQLAKQSYAKALQVEPKTKINPPQLTLLGSIGPDKRSAVAASSLPATVTPSPKPAAQTTGTSAAPATLPASAPAQTPGVAPVVAPVVATAPVATQATGVTPAKPSPTASTTAPAQTKASPSAPPSAVAAQAKQPAPATAAQATATEPAATKNSTAAKTEEADVRAAVQAWAKAWSQKDMSRYFAAYTSSFAGGDRQSRAKWESDRQVRIVSKKSISVVANHLKIEVNGNKATAQFQQIYESDNFKGNSRKTLEMVKHGERWLIARETVN